MNDSVHFNREHELHGKIVINPKTLETKGLNLIVHQDDSVTMASHGKVSGDLMVTRSTVENIEETLNEEGWKVEEMKDFIEQTHELEAAVESGEFDI